MKTRIIAFLILVVLFALPGFAQEKSRKQLKEEEKQRKIAEVENLLNTKDFVFVARFAMPVGRRQVDLSGNPNFVKFNPELFDGYMPFFGEATAMAAYGGDGGIKFREKPTEYTVEKKKKNFLVEAQVKGETDVYRLSLTVSFEGSASLSVISNNRSTISYQGEVMSPENHGK